MEMHFIMKRQKVHAIRSLCKMYGLDIDIIQGKSGAQSGRTCTGALSEGAWTPRFFLQYLTIGLLNDVRFTSYFSCVDTIESFDGSFYTLPDVKTDKHETTMLPFLPIRDYPLFLISERTELKEV